MYFLSFVKQLFLECEIFADFGESCRDVSQCHPVKGKMLSFDHKLTALSIQVVLRDQCVKPMACTKCEHLARDGSEDAPTVTDAAS